MTRMFVPKEELLLPGARPIISCSCGHPEALVARLASLNEYQAYAG